MADQTEEDIEFIPSDEILEAEPGGAEDSAVHIWEREESRGLMVVEAEDFDAEQLEEAEAEEVELEADEVKGQIEKEHEEDVEEVLRHHYGIVGGETDEELVREEAWLRQTGAGEFVCRSCFLRKPASQRSDAGRDVCVDCAANGA